MVIGEIVTDGKDSDVSYNRLLSTAGGKSFKREPAQEERCLIACSEQGKKTGFMSCKFCSVRLVQSVKLYLRRL